MKITAIKAQVKRPDRYSIYVDDTYAFSLSDQALLETRLAPGDELDEAELKRLKQRSADDKLYAAALRYVALRPRSTWEMESYLLRKGSPAPLNEQITNKLCKLDLLNDEQFARSFVADRRLLRPTSRRRLIMELRKKRVNDEIIRNAVGSDQEEELSALRQVIERKRRQSRYQDEQKLMQYLARQGYAYDDIKAALRDDSDDL